MLTIDIRNVTESDIQGAMSTLRLLRITQEETSSKTMLTQRIKAAMTTKVHRC